MSTFPEKDVPVKSAGLKHGSLHKSWWSKLGVIEWSSVFVALVVFSFIVASMNVESYLITHSLKNYRLSPGDEIAVSKIAKDLSSYLCSEYEVRVSGEHRGVTYLLDASSELKTRRQTQDLITMEGLNGHSDYRYKSFYLQETSKLVVRACYSPAESVNQTERTTNEHPFPNRSQVLVFKGHSALNKWMQSQNKEDFVDKYALGTLDIIDKSNCSDNILDVYVEHPDTYYVILTQSESDDFIGRVEIALERQYYSISTMIDACYYDTLCTFSLPYAKPVEIVVLLGDNAAEPDSPAYLSTSCQPRILFWIAVFGAPPMITVIGAIIMCCLFGWSQKRGQLKGKEKLAFVNQALDNTSLKCLKNYEEQAA